MIFQYFEDMCFLLEGLKNFLSMKKLEDSNEMICEYMQIEEDKEENKK